MKGIKRIVVRDSKESGYEDPNDYLKEVCQHGCVSGMVGRLIYYSDTLAFFKKHKSEINELLKENIESSGLGIHELFGDKFDQEDPLCQDTQNQNLLAWFGYEETCYRLLNERGIEF